MLLILVGILILAWPAIGKAGFIALAVMLAGTAFGLAACFLIGFRVAALVSAPRGSDWDRLNETRQGA